MTKKVEDKDKSDGAPPEETNTETTTTQDVQGDDVLRTALEDAQTKAATTKAELARVQQLYDTKVTEHTAVVDELADLKGEFKRQLAMQLVTIQMQLGKPSVSTVKDSETFKAAVDALAERTIESLRDSVDDLIPELSDAFTKTGLPSFIKNKSAGKPPTLSRKTDEGGNVEVKDAKEEDTDPLDEI